VILSKVTVGLVPVAVEALEDDAVLRHALDEPVRPRAHRLAAEAGAGSLRGLRAHHHAGAVGQCGQQRRERRAEVELDGQRVHHVHAGQRGQLATAVGALQRLVALEVELHRGSVELFAVVERHAGAQLHRQRLVVGRPFPARRQLRHDGELLVDVDQLVAQCGEHDAADEGARQRGVEHVGVLGQADAQGLRGGGRRGGQQQRGQQGFRAVVHRGSPWE
jgi:hypothetical protein